MLITAEMNVIKTILLMLALHPFIVYPQGVEPVSLSRNDSAILEKALSNVETELKAGDLKQASDYYNQAAMMYWEHNQFGKAVEYYLLSLELNKKLSNENGIAMINSNLALLYADMGQFEKALDNFRSTYSIRKSKHEKIGTISALINMSVVLNNMKDFERSATFLHEALDIAREMSDAEQMKSCYGMLSETYEKAGLADTAFYYFNLYKSFHEMIQTKRVAKSRQELENQRLKTQLAEAREEQKKLELLKSRLSLQRKDSALVIAGDRQLELTADLTDREMELELVKLDAEIKHLKASNELEKRRKRYILMLSIAVILIGVVAFQLYLYRLKRMSNHKLKRANTTIKEKNDELQLQYDKINSQNKEISLQRDKIKEINTEITDSINYAKYIQQAILPNADEIKSNFDDYFLVFKPKNIVSGDFYWAGSAGGKHIVAVADCTGHGVPGAFMSMLGMTLLNEIVVENEIADSAQILNKLRNEVIHSLHQSGQVGEQHDGMDIAVCVLDYQRKTVQFSGANNPLYVARGKSLPPIENTVCYASASACIYELKCDRMPVCIYDRMDDFSSETFSYEQGDMIYLFSDGYADQFGGENNKKLKYKGFKNILLNCYNMSAKEQQKTLDEAFEKWKGAYKQIDDVIIMGIRLT